jgi:hypothetical protein
MQELLLALFYKTFIVFLGSYAGVIYSCFFADYQTGWSTKNHYFILLSYAGLELK